MRIPRLTFAELEAAADRWNAKQYKEQRKTGLEGEDRERIVQRLKLKGYSYREAHDVISLSERGDTQGQGPNLLERIIAENDLTPIGFLMKGLACTFTVCRIVIKSQDGGILGYGTGFRISPRLIMTNNHVLSSPAAAALSVAQFDYREGPSEEPPEISEVALDAGAFFKTNRDLDCTIVALNEERALAMTASGRPWLPLIRESGKALENEPVNVIQHPRGELMRVAFRNNTVFGRDRHFIHYSTDTEPGSSGSPVLSDNWDLAALHHAGVPRKSTDGKILKRDGTPFIPGSDISEIDWAGNEGIRISSIVAHFDNLPLSGNEAKLYGETFEDPDWSGIMRRATAGAFKALAPGDGALESFTPPAGPVQRADGRTSWFFEFSVGPVTAPPAAARPAPAASAQAPAVLSGRIAREPGQDVRAAAEALLEFLKPRDEPYYDAASDAAARAAYYGNFRPGAARRTFDHLSRLLLESHGSPVSYATGRKRLYAWADAHSDGTKLSLRSVYSGEPMEQIDVIAGELANEIAVDPELLDTIKEGNFERYLALESLTERVLMEEAAAAEQPPFDCEHVVPQSWFDKKIPMVGDMHHLFTCEKGCNRGRGNTPYFDFDAFDGTDQAVDAQERIKDKCGFFEQGDDGKKGFEPQWHGGRGAVARATLYFLLRYPRIIGDPASGFQQYDARRLPLLLNWHRRHPPTEWEMHRNATIQKEQGNRNPLIDFPGFDWTPAHFELGLGN